MTFDFDVFEKRQLMLVTLASLLVDGHSLNGHRDE